MFEILGGRKSFFQWDINQKLIIYDDSITEVHFCNKSDDCALVCEVNNYEEGLSVVSVPNILLQDCRDIRVYGVAADHTEHYARFAVISRSKPADYIYTETEVKNWEELLERMNTLEYESIPEQKAQIEANTNDIENLKEEIKDKSILDIAFRFGDITTQGFNNNSTTTIRSEFIRLVGYDYIDVKLIDDSFRFAMYGYNEETEEIIKYVNNDFVYHGTIRCDNPNYSYIIRVRNTTGSFTPEAAKSAFLITFGNYETTCKREALGNVCKGANAYFKINEPYFEHSIETTGYVNHRSNAVTKPISIKQYDGIRFTFDNDKYQYSLHSVDSDGVYKKLNSGYIKAPAEYTFTDNSVSYIVMVDLLGSTANFTQENMDALEDVVNIEAFYINTLKEDNNTFYGYERQYTDITQSLNWEDKQIPNNNSFALLDGNRKTLVARLPAGACWEVKKNEPNGRFRIAEFDYMSFMPSEYNHYAERKCDTYSEWFVEASYENNSNICSAGNSELNYEVDKNISGYACSLGEAIRVFTFNDIGVIYNKGNSKLYGKKIAMIGDSIVQGRFCKYGTEVNLAMAKPWSHLVAEMCNVEPANYGIGGARVQNNDWKSLYRTCNNVSGYDVVFICAGTNDYGGNVAEATFREAFDYVLTTLKENNKSVVVCTPTYRTNKTAANSAGLTLADYANIEKQLADVYDVQVIDLYNLTNNNAFKATLTDGLHPDETGHRMLADIIIDNY